MNNTIKTDVYIKMRYTEDAGARNKGKRNGNNFREAEKSVKEGSKGAGEQGSRGGRPGVAGGKPE